MVEKKKVFLVVMMSIFMLFTTTAFAAESDIPDATNQFYVNDFANVIDDELEKEMQANAVALAESSDGIQVVVTTVQTIGDADPVYYTVDMYNKYGIGKNNMGVLIMLSVETRDIQVRLGDNMTKYLSDRKSGEIIDEYGIPYFKNDEFAKGLSEMQKATIEHITSKVKSANNEVAVVPNDAENVGNKGILGMIFGSLAVIGGGILSFFGIDKYLKKRKEKKAAEEIARIQNSELVQRKNQRIEILEAELTNERYEKEGVKSKLENVESELYDLNERMKRAIIAYPDLDEKINEIFLKEKEEADKGKALEVENLIKEVMKLEFTRHNLYKFESACNAFEDLSRDQQKYVPSELVTQVRNAYDESLVLQRKFEEEERIRRNKEKASEVQTLILGVLACSVTRHVLSDLKSACNAYDNLTNEQKQYVTADVDSLHAMRRKAQRLQDEYEENERRRRQREDEERRRRMSYNSSFSGSRSSFGGSRSGFGGRSGGHGAGRKF